MAYPKTLGACVDQLYKMRESRLVEEKRIDELKKKESDLRDHILKNFAKTDIEGAKGKVASASVSRKTVAQVEDWTKVFSYIAKNDAWDLLQKRMNDSAFRERIEANETIPGAQAFVVVGLSVNKVGAKP